MSPSTLRCGSCDYWLGESSVELIRVETVHKSEEVRIAAPRDLRLCKGCGKVTVFIAKRDVETAMMAWVG